MVDCECIRHTLQFKLSSRFPFGTQFINHISETRQQMEHHDTEDDNSVSIHIFIFSKVPPHWLQIR
jgi:hypothetical protein